MYGCEHKACISRSPRADDANVPPLILWALFLCSFQDPAILAFIFQFVVELFTQSAPPFGSPVGSRVLLRTLI